MITERFPLSSPLLPAASRGYLFTLLLAAGLLWGWNYGLWDLEGPDEGRYVQVAKELYGRSDWLRLTVNGEAYKEKPPLPFWMIAGSMKLGGGEVSAWTARLPSVLAGLLTVLLVFDIGRARWNARAGFLAGLVLLTAPLFARQIPSARLDGLFTAWITLTAWAWLTAPPAMENSRLSAWRAAIFWTALAGAFFTKGPLALVAMLGMLLGESWRSRSWAPWRSVWPLVGVLMLIALIGGWLASQYAVGGADFVRKQISTGTLGRILNGSHENPVWYYAVTLLEDVFHPWLVFLAAALVSLWRERKRPLPEGLRPLLFWIAAVLLILHVSSGKRTQYLLPVLPAMALITGWYIDARVLDRALPRWARGIAIALAGLLAVTFAASAVFTLMGKELLWPHDFYLEPRHAAIAAVLFASAGVTTCMLFRRRSAWMLVMALAALTLSVEIFYASIVNTARNLRRSSWTFSRTVEGMLPAGETVVGALGRAENPRFHVYGHYGVLPLDPRDDKFEWDDTMPRLLVARAEDSRFIDQARDLGGYRILGTVEADGEPLTLMTATEEQAEAELYVVPLRLAVAGDTGTDSGEQRDIVRQMMVRHAERPLGAVLLLGDNLYGDEPFRFAFRRRYVEPFEPLIRAGIPFYAALGNHDGEGGRREGEICAPLFRMEGSDYYTRTLGDNLITLIALNSETLREGDRAQLVWFEKALRASTSAWTVVILHRPVQASLIAEGGDDKIHELIREDLAGPWAPDLVLSGHNHLYERRLPVAGVHHLTTGSGGKLDDDEIFPEDHGRAAGYNERRSFVTLDVYPDRIEGEAIAEDGEVVDRFTLQPRPRSAGVTSPPSQPETAFRPS